MDPNQQDPGTVQPGTTPPAPTDSGQGSVPYGTGQGGPASPYGGQGGWQPPAAPEPAAPSVPETTPTDTSGGDMGGGSDTGTGTPSVV